MFIVIKKILLFLETRDEFQSLYFEESHQRTLFLLLREISFFNKSFPHAEDLLSFISHSSSHFHFERFPKGSIIFNINDQADKFYLILKGRVGVFVPQNSDEIKSSRTELLVRQSKGQQSQQQSFQSPFMSPSGSPLLSPLKMSPIEDNFENFFLQTPEIRRRYFEEELFIYKLIKVLSEKDCFGELALSNNKPRSATILALQDLCVLTLSKEDFEREFAKMINESHEKFAFFQKLFTMNQNQSSSSALMRVIYYFNEIEFPPNQTIFHEGEKTNGFYVIVRGEIEISRLLKEDEKKNNFEFKFGNQKKGKIVLNIAKLGDFSLLGEDDLIEEKENRSYTATTVTQAKLYMISKKVNNSWGFLLLSKKVEVRVIGKELREFLLHV